MSADNIANQDALRASLAPLAKRLRELGATVEVTQPASSPPRIVMEVSAPVRLAGMIRSELTEFSAHNDSKVHYFGNAWLAHIDDLADDDDNVVTATLTHAIARERN